eukprot:CAMPEP_0119412552 /NCGR_PEP_ID=MMETSP1335-20130426/4956_1 /TAXON_ID=259385 /ORGANISM="Chrysoculter rhomboideus, Strain RCC1486" /LENGTH=67 /DNA_ID=CAMNT_0007437303 /DNA_START=513 /DNA_END=716 /DNA_ORIENTATION=-
MTTRQSTASRVLDVGPSDSGTTKTRCSHNRSELKTSRVAAAAASSPAANPANTPVCRFSLSPTCSRM